jgi:RNA polymerase sigma-70 factor (ECF subfamily)
LLLVASTLLAVADGSGLNEFRSVAFVAASVLHSLENRRSVIDSVNVIAVEPDLVEPTDRSLLRRFRQGEGDAATQLYLRYAQRLIAFAEKQTSQSLAIRFDPEDVVQSVFRTFFRRATEGGIQVPAGEELWQLLLVIALNKIRRLGKFHRRQRRDVRTTVSTETIRDTDTMGQEASFRMLRMVVDEALEQLPAFQRTMIEMRIQGYSIVEIAEHTQRCRRTVERVLRQFRDYIAEYIDTDDNATPTLG